ncbi:MAG: molybdenum cofactor guanylyltransferase MobA [Pseudomonadota bacterium]
MRADVVAVILAGGQSRRMGGGDKCLMELAGRPLIAHVIERVRPQVAAMVINTNSEPAPFASFGLPIMADIVDGHAGPLAGVLAGMTWAADNHPAADWLVSVAADTPFFPLDLVDRLAAACADGAAELACAASIGRTHPVFGLWPLSLRADLHESVTAQGVRKVDQWTANYQRAVAEFGVDGVDPFFNINRPDDFDFAKAVIARPDVSI